MENDQLFHYGISVSIIESLKHSWLLAGEKTQALEKDSVFCCQRHGIQIQHRDELNVAPALSTCTSSLYECIHLSASISGCAHISQVLLECVYQY